MSFRVGQKVVFVGFPDDTLWERIYRWCHPMPPGPEPVVGNVYTIERIVDCGKYGISLHLREITSVPSEWWEAGFLSDGFRPVVERSTDTGMAILRQILTDHKTPIRETAARVTAPVDHTPTPLS